MLETPPLFTASIVIPVLNRLELTRQCLIHLAQVTHGLGYEVIVVDNASTDGTPEFLTALGGDVQIIRNNENLGFAKACNQGAHAARGRYLVFLNNDTIPLDGWLNALVCEVERDLEVSVVGSKLLYPNGTIQHAGVAFSRNWFSPYHIYMGFPAYAPMVNRRREFQAVTAACMLVRREIFDAVGGFDEGYVNGFEDADLCLKIRERGGRIVYQPQSVLYHLESQTPGRKAKDRENLELLIKRWGHKWLEDEDAIYLQDSYANRVAQDTKGDLLSFRLEQLMEDKDRNSWAKPAEVQERLLGMERCPLRSIDQGDEEAASVWRLLARAEEWPEDVAVLRWGAQACRWAGAPTLAENFQRRLRTLGGAPPELLNSRDDRVGIGSN